MESSGQSYLNTLCVRKYSRLLLPISPLTFQKKKNPSLLTVEYLKTILLPHPTLIICITFCVSIMFELAGVGEEREETGKGRWVDQHGSE